MLAIKRIFSLLLALAMVVGMLPPMSVSASEAETIVAEEATATATAAAEIAETEAPENVPVKTSAPAVAETIAPTLAETESAVTEPTAVDTSSTETVNAVVVTDGLGVYSTPSESGTLLYTIPVGTEVAVVRQETVMDVTWGLIYEPDAGWIMMAGVQVGGEIPQETTYPTETTVPVSEEAESAPTVATEPEEVIPETTAPIPTETVPDSTVGTEPEQNVPETTGPCGDNLTWNFADGALTISGSGDMYGYDGGMDTATGANHPWADWAADIQTVIIGEGVTSIGHNAFRGFEEMTQISIPGTVTSIGEAAFGWCTSLTEMTLPEGVMSISSSAFVACTALTVVTLPESLEVAGPFCFDRCTSLTSLIFQGDVPDLSTDYFLEGLTLTAYYPGNNPTWTSDKLVNYGGNITWKPYGTKATQLVIQGLDPDSYQGQMIGREDTLSIYAVPSDAVVDVEFSVSDSAVLEITGQYGDSCTVIPRNPGAVTVTATDNLSGISVSREITIVEPTQITLPFTDRIPITGNAVSRYYSFTPTVSGRYVFTSANCELNKSTIRVESLGSGNLMCPFDNLDDTVYRTYADLTAGKTYQIRSQYTGMTPGSVVEFTVEYQASIPDVTEIRMSADNIRCNVLPNGTHFRVLAELLPAGSEGTITWESSDETVAEIKSVYGNACYIVPKRIGTATLTAHCNGLEASATIVVEAADVLTLNQPVELDPDDLYSLQVFTFTPEETGEYVFKADVLYSDPYIMDLLTRADGTYVPLRLGYGENGSEEYAELQAGETYNLYVGGSMDMALQKPTVTFSVEKAAGDPQSLHLKRLRNGHEQLSIGAYFGPENTYEEVVSWEVDDSTILEYVFDSNNECYFNIIGKGTATITATSASGLTGSITIQTDPCSGEHKYGSWLPVADSAGNPTGDEYRLCSRCGEAEFWDTTKVTSGTCGDNAYWNFDKNSGTLTISGTGAIYDYTGNDQPWRTHFSNAITSIVVEEGITAIGDDALAWESNLVQITLPNTLERVGQYAFAGHVALKAVHLPDGVTELGDGAFAWCIDLADVTLPEGIPEIGFETFRECLYIKDITIPASVKVIENDAFRWCSAERLWFLGDAPAIGDTAFNQMGKLVINYPADNTTWDNVRGLYGCSGIWWRPWDGDDEIPENSDYVESPDRISASGTWGDNITWKLEPSGKLTISGTGKMRECYEDPNNMGPDNTFPWKGDYMNDILEVVVEEGITALANNAFSRCGNLAIVTLPDSMADTGDNTFTNCFSLEDVYFGSGLSRIGAAFGSCGLTEIVIPGSVQLLDPYAFYGCEKLKTVVLEEGVTDIGRSAFRDCTALTSVTLPESLLSIGKNAFDGCTKLEAITIPAGIEELGRVAFYGCDSLQKIVFAGTAPQFDANTFLNLTATAYYPADNATWTDDVLQNYGGSITWVPAGVDVTTLAQLQAAINAGEYSIRIAGNITLKKDLTIPEGVTVTVNESASLTVAAKKTLDIGGSLIVKGTLTVKGKLTGNKAIAEQGSFVSAPEGTYATRNRRVTAVAVSGIPEMAVLGHPVVLTAVITPADAWNHNATWRVIDGSDIAEIGETTGELIASAPGTVTVRAEAADGSGSYGEAEITFSQTRIALAEGSARELTAGKSASFKVTDLHSRKTFKASQILWEVAQEDAPFASVTAAGKLTAYKTAVQAEVTLTARVKDHPEYGTAEHKVCIYPVADRLEILQGGQVVNGQTLYVDTDEEMVLPELSAVLYPAGAKQAVTWKLSKTKIAAVDPNTGRLTWKGIDGTVTLTATANDGSKQKASVTICFADLAESITIDNLAENQPYLILASFIGKTHTIQMKATTVPADAGVVWSLAPGDEAYASITPDGKLKNTKKVYENHLITVIATTKDGRQSTSCPVQVWPNLGNDFTFSVRKLDNTNLTNQTFLVDVLDPGACSIDLKSTAYSTMGCDNVGDWSDVEWKSSNPKVASVQPGEDGTVTVTVHKAGTAKITATCWYGGEERFSLPATVTIKAVKLTDKVTVTEKNGANTLAAGKSLNLKAALTARDGKAPTTKGVTWSLAEGGEAYAKITAKGKLTAHADYTGEPVTVTVLAESKDGGAACEYPVTVHPIARGMRLYLGETETTNTQYTHDLELGTALQLTAAVYPLEGANQNVTWKSSGKKIAEVDPVTGKITCHKPGTVTITATANDGSKQKASFTLTLIRKTRQILLENAVIAGGKTLKLKPVLLSNVEQGTLSSNQKVTWTLSGDVAYATLNNKGALKTKQVTSKKTVYLTATAVDDPEVSVTCRVQIYPAAVKKITFWDGGPFPNNAKLTMSCGQGWDMYAEVTPEEACSTLVWKSSDPSVVSVDSSTGEFLCLKPGKATLSATAVDGSGKKATLRITVK